MLEHGLSKLFIFDIDVDVGKVAIEQLILLDCRYERDVTFVEVDIANEDDVNVKVAEIAETCGRIDILVSFAGITGSKLAIEYPLDAWKAIFDVNVYGTFLVARAVARYGMHS